MLTVIASHFTPPPPQMADIAERARRIAVARHDLATLPPLPGNRALDDACTRIVHSNEETIISAAVILESAARRALDGAQ